MSTDTGAGAQADVTTSAAAGASPEASAIAQPVYLIAGGHPPNTQQTIQDCSAALQACATPHPTVAYVGTASGDNRLFFRYLKSTLLKAGAATVTLAPLAGKRANPEKAQRILRAADAIFLSGGEVEDGIAPLRSTGLDAVLTELYQAGTIFFGMSAGCIMMGEKWVHWDVEDDDSTASLFDCLGFVPMTFDTHCEHEDWKELKCALRLMGPGARGYGLSSGGFYTADPAGRLSAYRNGPATFYNREGEISDRPSD